jgi:TolA-binding protein
MNKLKLIFFNFFILILISGCFKTSEDLKKEKIITDNHKRINDTQQMLASLKINVDQIQQEVNRISGEIEEMKYYFTKYKAKSDNKLDKKLLQNNEKLSNIEQYVSKQKKLIHNLKKQAKKQQNFISVITDSMKKEKYNRNVPLYKKAGYLYSKKQYKKALEMYLVILDSKKTRRWLKELSLLRVGVIYYKLRKYEEAIQWHSTLYTNYNKSKYVADSLYYIALCFNKQGKKEEARTALQEIINKYKKSSRVKSSKKLLKSWKK